MDRWLNKSKNTVGSSSSKSNECMPFDTTVSKKRRKYDENYISFGFMDENGFPQCISCSKIFPNSSMVPAKLRCHLDTNHKDIKDKPIDYFIRKRNELIKNKNFIAEVSITPIKRQQRLLIWLVIV